MKRFDNVVIVTDLDGTFLDSGERVAAGNREAVEYFKANGGRFSIATGRVAQHVFGAVPDVRELVNFPAVTCNGACLYDFDAEISPIMHAMSFVDVCDLIGFIRENYPTAGIRASSPDYCFVVMPEDTDNKYIRLDMERYKGQSNLTAPLEDWAKETVCKVVIRIDEQIIAQAMEHLKRHFGDRFSVTQSWATIIDVQLGGVNKGSTLMEYVRATLGNDAVVYACGDYLNDLELLLAADVAVCPTGAHEAIKAVSELCLCSNDEGLIARLVEYLDKDRDNK